MLFEISSFAQARISGKVSLDKLNKLEVGESYIELVALNLSLHGISNQIKNNIRVTKLKGSQIHITSIRPVLIKADDYALSEGVEKLRKIASLPSITGLVPVTFDLVFIDK